MTLGRSHRWLLRWAILLGGIGSAHAQSPPPDGSVAAFAGEWIGTGEQGSFCFVKLVADGSGQVMIDGGSGDWLAARIRWRNEQQALRVDQVVPAPASVQKRIMPLQRLALHSGFNQSLVLTWSDRHAGCQMQRADLSAKRLARARDLVEKLPTGAGGP
jgi:hypothetical protein